MPARPQLGAPILPHQRVDPRPVARRELLIALRSRPPALGVPVGELRRKWATEREGYPVKDVAAAGGGRDERTILTSCQWADAATASQVVLLPTQ